ncbi:MAG: sugar phosphate isomerase/epimerase family protein [Capsulimonadales bacterium]|nr:sugar phosphate isomerase/epimerase family protein [Capsulimonadales bacterium]
MSALKLGISSYSFWHFRGPKFPIETVIERASDLGVQGVEVLHRQMESEERDYLHRLKRHAFRNGVDLVCLSIHQNFVLPDPEARKTHIDHTIRCIEIAHEMGVPCIRLNSGRWGTVDSFDRLMELRGEEPPLPGHTEDEAFAWCIDATERCVESAGKYGVTLALENHWGLTREPEGVLRIVDAIDSPWLSVLADTGNFLEEPYDRFERLAARAIYVHAKTYFGGGEWYTLDLDYRRIAAILAAARYRGYVSLEFEGKEDPETAVPASLALLRDAFTPSAEPAL